MTYSIAGYILCWKKQTCLHLFQIIYEVNGNLFEALCRKERPSSCGCLMAMKNKQMTFHQMCSSNLKKKQNVAEETQDQIISQVISLKKALGENEEELDLEYYYGMLRRHSVVYCPQRLQKKTAARKTKCQTTDIISTND